MKQLLTILTLLTLFTSPALAITLNWTASQGNPVGYRIYYSDTTPSNLEQIAEVQHPLTAWPLDHMKLGIKPGQHHFAVSAYNAAGESAMCPPATHTVSAPETKPTEPTNPHFTSLDCLIKYYWEGYQQGTPGILGTTPQRGGLHIYLECADTVTDIESVVFFLDGVRRNREIDPPYDFHGVIGQTDFQEFDTRQLDNGFHYISAIVTTGNGLVRGVSASFEVQN